MVLEREVGVYGQRASPIRGILATGLRAAVGGLAVFSVVGLRAQEPPWSLGRDALVFGLVQAAAFAVGLFLERSRLLQGGTVPARLARSVAIASLCVVPALVAVPLFQADIPRSTILLVTGMVYLLLVLNSKGLPAVVGVATSLVVVSTSTVATLASGKRADPEATGVSSASADSSRYLFTSLHDIKARFFQVVPAELDLRSGGGGGLEVVDSGHLLLADAEGRFFELTLEGDAVKSTPLPRLRARFNREAYETDVAAPSRWFRVTDLLLVRDGNAEDRTLYVAQHRWDPETRCAALTVDEAVVRVGELDKEVVWSERYRTQPCLPASQPLNILSGGRMALRGPGALLLSVGVSTRDNELSPAPRRPYGSVVELDRKTWRARTLTTGHRNPQGLLVDGSTIWSTEHGPRGGDELNLLSRGKDYGWPASSYGLEYGRKTLRTTTTPGEHAAGERPRFAWVPSIGVSQLLKVDGTGFTNWRGDLLVGSLLGKSDGRSLFRVRHDKGQVRLVERIPVGAPVRDLVETPGGQILTWDGMRTVQVLAPTDHVFAQCATCHALSRSELYTAPGPALGGVVGRKVASDRDFDYSEALRALGGNWSPERLDWFLRAPQTAVPGTKMDVPGIEDPAQRRELIRYLKEARRR